MDKNSMSEKRLNICISFVCLAFSNLIFSGIISLSLFKLGAFAVLVMVPGYFLSLIFRINKEGRYLFSLGFGLAFLMFVGLIVNTVLPLVGIDDPLKLMYLLSTMNAVIVLFGITAWRLIKTDQIIEKSYLKRFLAVDNKTRALVIFYILTPLISAGGAIRLNNGANNNPTMGLIVVLVMLWIVTLLWKRDAHKLYPIALYSSALTLLLMYSLRSNYVVGWDIQSEIYVFKLTALHHRWLLGSKGNPYNATLSLTILPTIFKEFLRVNFDTVFKFYFPLLAASMAGAVFLIAKRFLQDKWAFLVALFFIVQPEFMQEMPALDRQEIAFIFFLLFLCLIFQQILTLKIKKLLFIVFGISMIVSHYSTAYVCLSVLLISYIISRIFIRTSLLKKQDFLRIFPSGLMIITLVIITLFWYGQLAGSTGNLSQAFSSTIHNLANIGANDARSSEANQVIGGKVESNVTAVSSYRQQIFQEDSFLRSDKQASSVDLPASPSQLPVKNTMLSDIILVLDEIAQKTFKVLLFIGMVFYFVRLFRNKEAKLQPNQLVLLNFALSFGILAAAVVLLPSLSLYYNFDRLYQQALPLFGIIMVVAVIGLAKFMKFERYVMALFTFLVLVYFLNYIGFFTALVGGGNPTMQLTNFGDTYNRFYNHDGEVYAAQWIVQNKNKNENLVADTYGTVKLDSVYPTTSTVSADLAAEALNGKAFIFVTYANLHANVAYAIYDNNTITYTFPSGLINDNRALIYTNNDSQVFE